MINKYVLKLGNIFRLLLKTHNPSGLKYLCVTRRPDWKKYKGSGIYWGNFIKKHGADISTELLYESEGKTEDFIEKCKYYSTMWDVQNNPQFANLIPEDGNSSWYKTEYCSEEAKKNISLRRKALIYDEDKRREASLRSKAFWSDEKRSAEVRKTISIKMKKWCSLEENAQVRRLAAIECSKRPENKIKRRKASIQVWESRSVTERKDMGKKIALGRLAMSAEDKAKRGEKIAESFRNSEKRKVFNEKMKSERFGGCNPNSRAVFWYGTIFSSSKEFYEWVKKEGLSKRFCARQLENVENKECYLLPKKNETNKTN
jgi:hypothetical protein